MSHYKNNFCLFVTYPPFFIKDYNTMFMSNTIHINSDFTGITSANNNDNYKYESITILKGLFHYSNNTFYVFKHVTASVVVIKSTKSIYYKQCISQKFLGRGRSAVSHSTPSSHWEYWKWWLLDIFCTYKFNFNDWDFRLSLFN